MRNWPAGFITELQKKTGLTPCLILRTTIDGTVYHISDHVIAFPSGALGGFANVSTKHWVATWGQLHEQISGNIGEILIADMSLTLLVDQNDANNIRHLALQHELEKNPTELYLWLPSLNAAVIPPQLVTKGHIEDIDLPDETQVNITIEDETSRLQDYLGTKITSEAYPLADPDTVGKMIPIVIGTVPKLPALCVDSGWVSSLVADIDPTQTTFKVSEVPAYPLQNKSITIDDEQMLVVDGGAPDATRYNYALSSRGGTTGGYAGAYPYSQSDKINNGKRTYTASGDGWIATDPASQALHWLGITFAQPVRMDEFRIYFIADNYTSIVDPDVTTPGTLYAHAWFDVYVLHADGVTWSSIYTTTTNNKALVIANGFGTIDVLGVQVYLRSPRRDGAAWSVVEMEAYGTLVPGNATTLTVLRGQGGTLPVVHTKGSTVIEKKATPLVYLVADHSVAAIGKVLARVRGIDVDISTDVTRYLGTSGNQLAAYPGKAAITVQDFAKVQQRIALALIGDVTLNDALHGHNAGTLNTTVTKNLNQSWTSGAPGYTGYPVQLVLNNVTYTAGWVTKTKSFYCNLGYPGVTMTGSTINVSFHCNAECEVYISGKYVGQYYANTGQKSFSRGFDPGTESAAMNQSGDIIEIRVYMAKINVASGQTVNYGTYTNYVYLYSFSRDLTYTDSTASNVTVSNGISGVTRTNTLQLSGNSVADIMLGDQVLVEVTAVNNSPFQTFSRLLSTYCGDTSLVQIGTLPSYYQFNGAITEYRKKIEWLDILAFQCRCWYRKIAGVSKLIVRQAAPDNPVTIPACCLTAEGIKDLRYRKAPKTDVINVINVLYDRDWSSRNANAEAYMSAKLSTDAASIADYGRIEQPSLFMFDFITSDSMAADVGSFFHDFYAVRKWLVSFPTYLDWAHLEFADDVLLPFANDLTGVIVEAGLDLASGDQMPKIAFTIATTKIPVEVANGIHTLLGIQVHTKNREVATYV